jgi:TolB-like protein
LPPKELAALRLLLEHAGQIVSPLQLKHALWDDVHVSADSVPKCLSSLRARLEPEDCIQTVYKRGYRFSAEVRRHGAAPAGALPRLAILPFATGYTVPEHLGPSIAEETIARLSNARYPELSVLARDSVFTLALRGQTAFELGQTLKADLVLTGTLSALAAHFRLRAEMIRVEDGTQIWVEDILVDQNRIAGLESELASRLAYRLGAGVPCSRGGSDRSSSLAWNTGGLSISAAAAHEVEDENGTRQREAYEIFLRGRHEWQTLERHRMQDGLQHLSRATELDPSLIAAKVELVHLCVTQAFYGFMSPMVAAGLVRRTADSIPDLLHQAEAILPALGWAHFNVDHNLSAALWAFAHSAHLPHSAWNTRERAMLALSRHRFTEAAELNQAALREDPFSPWLHARKAWIFHLSGHAAESLVQIHHGLDLFPDHEGIALYGSMILAFNGDAARGVQIAEELTRRQPYIDLVTAVHAYALACVGRTQEARTILERLQWLSRERFVIKSFNPAVYVALGDLDAALAELRAAAADRCPWFFQMLADPRLKPLHGRPEFDQMRAILARMEAEAAHELQLEA